MTFQSRNNKKLELDINKVIKEINYKTRLIVIANPNSPTGTIIENEQILKLKTDDIKIVKIEGVDRKIAEFPAGITTKGKKEFVVITEPLQEVLDQIARIKERPGFEKYQFKRKFNRKIRKISKKKFRIFFNF